MSNNLTRDINVLWVAESNWSTGSGIKPHEHDYYHMFMVRQGPLDFTIEKKKYSLEKGESIFCAPGVVHSLNDVTIHMGRAYEIKFTTQSPTIKKLLESLPQVLPCNPLAEMLVQELVFESVHQDVSSYSVISDYFRTLVDLYSRHYGKQHHSKASIMDTTGLSPVSEEIVTYLEANYTRELPLQEIADAVGFNKNYICSVFKHDTGITIGSCQTAIRIRKASEMISFSDMSLSQVASATGFANLSHFNRIFKKVTGIPPGQYRRMFTADMLIKTSDEAAVADILEQNGFIVSVLGRKLLTIAEIIDAYKD